MKDNNYKPRIIDDKVKEYLSVFGAICIEGPKWCGKTWTSRHHSNSEYLVGDPQNNFQNRQLALLSPALVLPGANPRLIDEWQEVTSIWDAVRYEVDTRGKKGQFILTGSSTPKRKGVLHSGVGRIGKLRMRPMTLYETGASSGNISLEELCNGKLSPMLIGNVDINNLIDYVIRGGWPGNQDTPIESAGLLPKEYISGVVDDEVDRIDDIQRDKRKVELLLRSLARNESTTVTNNTIMNDIKAVDDHGRCQHDRRQPQNAAHAPGASVEPFPRSGRAHPVAFALFLVGILLHAVLPQAGRSTRSACCFFQDTGPRGGCPGPAKNRKSVRCRTLSRFDVILRCPEWSQHRCR